MKRWALRYLAHIVGTAVFLAIFFGSFWGFWYGFGYLTEINLLSHLAGMAAAGKRIEGALCFMALMGLSSLPGLPALWWVAGSAWPYRARRQDMLLGWLMLLPVFFALGFAASLGWIAGAENWIILILVLAMPGFAWMSVAQNRAGHLAEKKMVQRFD